MTYLAWSGIGAILLLALMTWCLWLDTRYGDAPPERPERGTDHVGWLQ